MVFAGFNLPVNRIAIIEELATDPQVLENNMAAPPEDKSINVPMIINHPINVEHLPKVGPVRAPMSPKVNTRGKFLASWV